MKKVLFCLLLILVCAVSLAQTSYKQNLLNGDIKMQEHFYEMALSYYQKAKEEASTPAEASTAEQRIRECERALNPAPEETVIVSSRSAKSKKLFTDQYLETGDIYDASIQDRTPSLDESDYPLSLYHIEVYRDMLVILRHADFRTSEEVEELPSGTVLPLVKETAEYRQYASGEDGESFFVFKKPHVNSFGKFRMIYRQLDDKLYILYPMALVKKQMAAPPAAKEKEETQPKKEEKAEAAPILPITFTDHWILHFDEHGERIGDSRTAPIKARSAQWLMFRFRYTCPYSFKETHRFDMRLVDPSGELVVYPGKGAKSGYSASELLETIPGGGIFNIVVGSDTPGSFTKGEYRLSLYNGDNEYLTVTFVLE